MSRSRHFCLDEQRSWSLATCLATFLARSTLLATCLASFLPHEIPPKIPREIPLDNPRKIPFNDSRSLNATPPSAIKKMKKMTSHATSENAREKVQNQKSLWR